ncbi:11659_t:CDS:10 [Acaulospora colombiana]|uniref:11659_t:CDS:1 n=1 Tax=Acaulospora colombiana TaxID=27376 RepID=A0ACA9K9I4_9GLOM|nr:11659_t:CDS:10 [Acaulospora colombiana]
MSFDPDRYMVGPQGARRLGLVLGDSDPLTGISVIQQRYQVKVENIKNVYPLLESSGMSRYNIHAGILEELRDKFIKAIETEQWDQDKFNSFLAKTMSLLFLKELRPVLLALLRKYPERITSDVYAILAREPSIEVEAPIEIKRGLYARDKVKFKHVAQMYLMHYVQNQSLSMMAREMRGINVNDALDKRLEDHGLRSIINLVHESSDLFDDLLHIIREWHKEFGVSKICSFRFDFFMGMQKAGRIQMCKKDHSYTTIWYINGGIRKGIDLPCINQINLLCAKYKKNTSRDFGDIAMIFQDPIVYNVFAAKIVEILRKYVDDAYRKNPEKSNLDMKNPAKYVHNIVNSITKEKDSTLKWLSSMINLGSNSHTMMINKVFSMPQVNEEIYTKFYKQLLVLMFDDKGRHTSTINMFKASETTEDENDVPPIVSSPNQFGETEISLLKRSDMARKVFCHYMLERCEKGDIISLRRSLEYFRATMPFSENSNILHVELYESALQTLITLIIKYHRVRTLSSAKWSGVIRILVNMPWKSTIHELTVKLLNEYYTEEVSAGLAKIGCMEKYKLVRDWAESLASSYTKIGLKDSYNNYLKAANALLYKLNHEVTFASKDAVRSKPTNSARLFQQLKSCVQRLEDILQNRTTNGIPSPKPSFTSDIATSILTNNPPSMHLPMIPFSPLTRQSIYYAHDLATTSQKVSVASQKSSENQDDLASVRKLNEELSQHRARLDKVNSHIQSIAEVTLLHWDVDAVAQQLTIIDSQLYGKVDFRKDLLSKDRKNSKAQACLDFHRYLTNSFSHQFIIYAEISRSSGNQSRGTSHTRDNIIAHAVRIAYLLLHVHRNFNSFAALMKSLTSPEVRRVKRLWNGLSGRVPQILKEMSMYIKKDNNYKAYNEALIQKIDEFRESGEGMIVIPWMQPHYEEIKTITQSYSSGKSGDPSDVILSAPGALRLESIFTLLQKCQTNVAPDDDEEWGIGRKGSPLVSRGRDTNHIVVDGTTITLPLDLSCLGFGDLGVGQYDLGSDDSGDNAEATTSTINKNDIATSSTSQTKPYEMSAESNARPEVTNISSLITTTKMELNELSSKPSVDSIGILSFEETSKPHEDTAMSYMIRSTEESLTQMDSMKPESSDTNRTTTPLLSPASLSVAKNLNPRAPVFVPRSQSFSSSSSATIQGAIDKINAMTKESSEMGETGQPRKAISLPPTRIGENESSANNEEEEDDDGFVYP